MIAAALAAAVQLSSVPRAAEEDARSQLGYWSLVATWTDTRHRTSMRLFARLIHYPLGKLQQQFSVGPCNPPSDRCQSHSNNRNLQRYVPSFSKASVSLSLPVVDDAPAYFRPKTSSLEKSNAPEAC